jgi:polar amino acid transport system substrate-binding protein
MTSKGRGRIQIGLCVLFAVAVFGVSCSRGGGDTKGTAQGTGNKDTLAKILDAKKVKIGIMPTIPPYDYLDNNKQPTGYDVRVAQEIAKALGAELQLVQLVSQNRIPALQTGDVDLGVFLMGCYPERAKLVMYTTHPYMIQTIVMLGKKSLKAKSWDDLHKVKIGVVKGSGGLVVVEERAPKDAVKSSFDDDILQENALVAGQVDIIHADGMMAAQLMKQHPEAKLEVKWVLGVETEHLMVRKEDTALKEWLDVFLLSNYTNGHLGRWWDEYIKEMPLGDLPTLSTPLVPNGGSVSR